MTSLEELDARLRTVEVHLFGEPDPPPAPTTHTVVRGDTLGRISLRYGLTVEQLAAWNGIADPDVISVGQVLRLTAPDPVEPPPPPAPDPEPEPPAPDPEPDPEPPAAAVVFDGRFDRVGLAPYDNLQTAGHNGSPSGYRGSNLVLVDSARGRVAQVTVDERDNPPPDMTGGQRTELRLGDDAEVVEGDERSYRFGFMLDRVKSSTASDWFIIMQWHAGDGSPPLALQIDHDGWLVLSNNRDWRWNRRVARVVPGLWYDVRIDAKFSRSEGWAALWLDGEPILPRQNQPTMASGSNYMKLGCYRGRKAADTETTVVWHTGPLITRG